MFLNRNQTETLRTQCFFNLAGEMTVERHLIIQQLSLRPSGEWKPDGRGWTVMRVTEGAGYCLQGSAARELNAGDAVITGPSANAVFRASQLGVLTLEYFLVLPQYLNGLLTVSEWHQLEDASSRSVPRVLCFAASEPAAQKFARLAAQSQREGLPARSALLHLWASSIAGLLPAQNMPPAAGHLRERFLEFVSKMPETELATRSLTELAEQLHCSERHFSRLFRAEFNVSLRSRQTELRLQRARQLLADSNAKIINVAFDSGYRHLGLFNAMFKKRFGVTPSAWRQQNAAPPGNFPGRSGLALLLLLLLAQIFFSPDIMAQTTNATVKPASATTNAVSGLTVEKYLVIGNTILSPKILGDVFTNVPEAFGTNVTIDNVIAASTELGMAYRERGYVTVAVGVPRQSLTNATLKIKVTEGRLSSIKVEGNNWFSTPNVLRSLPSLHTNMLLNSHVFQRELDMANASRDRQIYPVIGAGVEPGTTELTLKVKDRFPAHARVEYNNTGTPGTPDDRVAFNAQYDNLWQLEHQVGVQYTFTPLEFSSSDDFSFSQIDRPLIANYSAYYRLPLGRQRSVQQQIEESNGRFGYNEVTHQFQMPSPTGRPELTFYASRSRSDTDVVRGPSGFLVNNVATNSSGVVYHPLSIATNSAGQNITLNENIGFKLSLPLPQWKKASSTITFGVDFKRFQQVSYNTNENFFTTEYYDAAGGFHQETAPAPQPQGTRFTTLDYFPISLGFSGSVPDPWGKTSVNAQANYNLADVGKMSEVAYTASAPDHYLTMQMGVTREQRIYHDWTVLIRADGQGADGSLISNEKFAMGGSAGVRGYADGAAYGDAGWRATVEPRTPLMNIGMVDGDVPFWLRASVFVDYGELYNFGNLKSTFATEEQFLGSGMSLIANIGNHFDARFAIAWPLIGHAGQDNGLHVYFGAGAQF